MELNSHVIANQARIAATSIYSASISVPPSLARLTARARALALRMNLRSQATVSTGLRANTDTNIAPAVS